MIDTAKNLGYQLVTVGDCLGDPPGNWYRDLATGEGRDARGVAPPAPPPPPQKIPMTSSSSSSVGGGSKSGSSSSSAPTPKEIPQTGFQLEPPKATAPPSTNSTSSRGGSTPGGGSSTGTPGVASTRVPDVGGRKAVPAPWNFRLGLGLGVIFGAEGGNVLAVVLGMVCVVLFWAGG